MQASFLLVVLPIALLILPACLAKPPAAGASFEVEELNEPTHHRSKRFTGTTPVRSSVQSIEEVTRLVKEPRNRLISDTVLPNGTRVMVVRGKFRGQEQVDYNDESDDVTRRHYRIKIPPGEYFVVSWQGNKVIPDSLNTQISSNGQYSIVKILTYIIRADGSWEQVDYIPPSSSARAYHIVKITVIRPDGTQEEVPMEFEGGKNIRVISATRNPDGTITIIIQRRIIRLRDGTITYLNIDDNQPGSELDSVVVRPRPDGTYSSKSTTYVEPPREIPVKNATPPPIILVATAAPPSLPLKGRPGDEFGDIENRPKQGRLPRPGGLDDEFYDVNCNCYRYPDGSIYYVKSGHNVVTPPPQEPPRNPIEEFYDVDCDCYKLPNGTITSGRKGRYPSGPYIRNKNPNGRQQIGLSDIAQPSHPDDGYDFSRAESGPALDLYKAYKGANSKAVGDVADDNDISPPESGPPLPSPYPTIHTKDLRPQGNVPPRSDIFLRNKHPTGPQIRLHDIERPSRIPGGRRKDGAGSSSGLYDGSGGRIERPSYRSDGAASSSVSQRIGYYQQQYRESGEDHGAADDVDIIRNKNKKGTRIYNSEVAR